VTPALDLVQKHPAIRPALLIPFCRVHNARVGGCGRRERGTLGNQGLCHDLDFFSMSGSWSQHGFLTGRGLGDGFADEALGAIAAHDQRTGIKSDTLIADML
jgi:hypothetical protein